MHLQVPPVVEGAVLGAYDPGRWKSSAPKPGVDRFVVCGADEDEEWLRDLAKHAELTARWTNVARELVDGPPNFVTPAGLAERAAALPGVSVEVIDPAAAGLPALAAVGGASAEAPKLIVLRYEPAGAPERPLLAFVGKAVTFDAGGYFLKPQSDIVRQKGDMAGGAAVLAALGAIAELELPLNVIGVLPACENMLGADAIRPSDVITTASGLTVEVTNPDAEGRLILADALWYARRAGRDAPDRPRDADGRHAGRDGRPLRRRVLQRQDLARRGRGRRQRGRRPRLAVAAAPSLPAPARVACRRPAQHLGAAVRISDHRRHVPGALRRRRSLGARRHARPGAARRRSRRRDRRRRERLRRAHARRGQLAHDRRAAARRAGGGAASRAPGPCGRSGASRRTTTTRSQPRRGCADLRKLRFADE